MPGDLFISPTMKMAGGSWRMRRGWLPTCPTPACPAFASLRENTCRATARLRIFCLACNKIMLENPYISYEDKFLQYSLCHDFDTRHSLS